MKYLIITATALFLSAGTAMSATQDISFTGNFSGDADVELFNFSIGAVSDVTLRSYSYAGGTMADGTVISAGGFDPILALWDSTGNLIQESNDGPDAVPFDPVTGESYDSNLLLTNLAAGTYTASIAQYANYAAGTHLVDGFTESDAFFTASRGCSNGQFCEDNVHNRTSFWAFDVSGSDTNLISIPKPTFPSPVPLPAGFPLLAAGLIGLGALARRKKST